MSNSDEEDRSLTRSAKARRARESSLAPLLQSEDVFAAVIASLEEDAERAFYDQASCNQVCEYSHLAQHLDICLPSLELPHGIAHREAAKRYYGALAVDDAALTWMAERLASALWQCYARCKRSLGATMSKKDSDGEGNATLLADERERLTKHLQAALDITSSNAGEDADADANSSGKSLALPLLREQVLRLLRTATADKVGSCAARLCAVRIVAATCTTARNFQRTRMLKLETSAGRALKEKLSPAVSSFATATALQAADGSGLCTMVQRALTAADLRLLRFSHSAAWLTGLGRIQLVLAPGRKNYEATIGPWTSALSRNGWSTERDELDDAQLPPGMDEEMGVLKRGSYSAFIYSETPLSQPAQATEQFDAAAAAAAAAAAWGDMIAAAWGDMIVQPVDAPLMTNEAVAYAVAHPPKSLIPTESWPDGRCSLKLIHGPLAGLCQVDMKAGDSPHALAGVTKKREGVEKFEIITFGWQCDH